MGRLPSMTSRSKRDCVRPALAACNVPVSPSDQYLKASHYTIRLRPIRVKNFFKYLSRISPTSCIIDLPSFLIAISTNLLELSNRISLRTRPNIHARIVLITTNEQWFSTSVIRITPTLLTSNPTTLGFTRPAYLLAHHHRPELAVIADEDELSHSPHDGNEHLGLRRLCRLVHEHASRRTV